MTKTPAPSRARPVALLVLGLLAGMLLGRVACAPSPGSGADAHDAATHGAEEAPTVWTCSMHPQVRLPEEGLCPICSMDLIPLQDDAGGLDPDQLRLSEAAVALAEIETRPVERRRVSRTVRMVGRVTFDETRLSYVTAWVPSRLDRLFVDYTGVSVREGDHMVEVYSPKLIATQQELLQAVAAAERLGEGAVDVLRSRQSDAVASARERLRLWGLEGWQIDEILEQGRPLEQITINSPVSGVVIHKDALQGDYVDTGTRIYTIADLSHVWVQLDAYESDLAWLHYGQRVTFGTEAWPGEEFAGRVSFIDPVLDDRTRTVKVRLNVDNADGRLKPDMFVRATVEAPMTASGNLVDPELAGLWMCPMHPEVVADAPTTCDICGMDLASTESLGFRVAEAAELPLVVPATAPLVTGTRAVVYVRLPGDEPVFEGREVTLGPRAGDWYVVREGLAEGERVVVHGAFKLDSELQIRGRPSLMNPDGAAPPSGHGAHGGHGGAGGHAARAGATAAAPHDAVPDAFREQLMPVLDAALEAQVALADDDDAAGRAAGVALAAALARIDDTALEGEARETWTAAAEALDGPARRLAEAADIEARRAALRDLTPPLRVALERLGPLPGDEAVGVFHCPMAFDDGADWLQRGDTTANPYYGDRMLRCGDRVRGLQER